MKVYISADIEGAAGVVHWDQCGHNGADFARVRRELTQEINAAIEGIFQADGDAEVVVNDGHADMRNILFDELDERAWLITGSPKPLTQMEGIDESYDAAMFVAYHARAGSEGVLSHTMTGLISSITVNGVVYGETGLNAALAGCFNVPVILVTGDRTVAREAMQDLGQVETVSVKDAINTVSAKTAHPQKAQAMIRDAAQKALSNLISARGTYLPLRVSNPVTVEVRFRSIVEGDYAARLPNFERTDGSTFRLHTDSYLEAFKWMRALWCLSQPR